MPSFDVVSEVDNHELRNAVDQANKEIANQLFVSEDTVKWHIRKIFRSLGTSNRTESVAEAEYRHIL